MILSVPFIWFSCLTWSFLCWSLKNHPYTWNYKLSENGWTGPLSFFSLVLCIATRVVGAKPIYSTPTAFSYKVFGGPNILAIEKFTKFTSQQPCRSLRHSSPKVGWLRQHLGWMSRPRTSWKILGVDKLPRPQFAVQKVKAFITCIECTQQHASLN